MTSFNFLSKTRICGALIEKSETNAKLPRRDIKHMINRKDLIKRHNPVLNQIDYTSPFSVGNGSFAFTADVTGMQSLCDDYEKALMPLTTMHKDGWHTKADENGNTYTLSDVVMTEYEGRNKKVSYPVIKQPGNEHIYDWVRQNPHRFSLFQVSLEYDKEPLKSDDITGINQELDLYTGLLSSSFSCHDSRINVQTVCSGTLDSVSFKVLGDSDFSDKFSVKIAFPYPSPSTKACVFNCPDSHTTEFISGENTFLFKRKIDSISFEISLSTSKGCSVEMDDQHTFRIISSSPDFEFSFSTDIGQRSSKDASFERSLVESKKFWEEYWTSGGIISFEGSSDKRAFELERRMILSMYLLRLNSCLDMPPQETGLTVNSWYGKSHLEMHLWHQAWLPLWGHGDLLMPSLNWYRTILDRARENAARNGYKGARWPKMVGPEGVDCPSKIAPLLIWQQPHILYMLRMLTWEKEPAESMQILEEYWEVIYETAEFMADFPDHDSQKDRYDLASPLIPAQERHAPMDTLNPVFEAEYWRYGLECAISFAKDLKKDIPKKWLTVAEKMARPVTIDGLYPAHENCPKTFSDFAEDHPSMVAALGLLPGEGIDHKAMSDTIDKIYETWDFKSCWGWDFAMLAMTLTRLGKPDDAVDILLRDTPKNTYSVNGHNYQKGRKDLPLYLPGNGSLLLALSLMATGWSSADHFAPGFSESFKIETEGFPEHFE